MKPAESLIKLLDHNLGFLSWPMSQDSETDLFVCLLTTKVDQLNDIKQLDQRAKGYNEHSMSNSNIGSAGGQSKQTDPAGHADDHSGNGNANEPTPYSQMSSESLYDEYKRRLELIKKFKPVN